MPPAAILRANLEEEAARVFVDVMMEAKVCRGEFILRQGARFIEMYTRAWTIPPSKLFELFVVYMIYLYICKFKLKFKFELYVHVVCVALICKYAYDVNVYVLRNLNKYIL